jgi:hypothetical protein
MCSLIANVSRTESNNINIYNNKILKKNEKIREENKNDLNSSEEQRKQASYLFST